MFTRHEDDDEDEDDEDHKLAEKLKTNCDSIGMDVVDVMRQRTESTDSFHHCHHISLPFAVVEFNAH